MPLFEYLETYPWFIGAIVLVAVFVLFTIVGVIFVRSFVRPKTLQAHHDVAGFLFNNLGVLYGVLLGFMVVNVQQRFDKIKESIHIEASYLAELYHNAEIFPEKNKHEIQSAVKSYGENVLNDEWDLMSKGIHSASTAKSLKGIWKAHYDTDPATAKHRSWYSQSISDLNNLMKVRLLRLSESQSRLGAEMWSMLILGGIVMMTFTWFFQVKNLAFHIIMASLLAAITAFILFLIYSLDTAFSGEISVPREAIEQVLKSFEQV